MFGWWPVVSGDGYRMGEMERIALAASNSDLRSDLLSARQEIVRLRAAGDAMAEWAFGDADDLRKLVDAVDAWQEARRER